MKKMSKKNNKGYSFTGLLAIIAIIAVIVSIILYFYTNIMNDTKKKSYQVTISSVEKNANNYIAKNNDDIFYLTSSNGKVEYQCITVGELIKRGYLDATIVDTIIDSNGSKISADDYIYIEKNASTHIILKSIYDKNNKHHCADAVKAEGDIAMTVTPDINDWSNQKTVNVTYKIKNYNSNNNYQYKYTILDANGNEIKENLHANSQEEIEITDTITINAEILDKYGSTVTQKALNIGMIDNAGPIITLNGTVITGNVNDSVRLPIIVTDTKSGIDNSSIDKTDFEVTIGGEKIPLSSIELTKLTETANRINYELIITDRIHRGNLEIKVLENNIFDKAQNGNETTKLAFNLTMNKVYKVIADSRGGTITSTTGWVSTGASATKNVTYGETYGMLPNVSNPGYSFIGWYTASSGGEKITNNSIVSITRNQVLYARWQKNNYKVVLVATGGTMTSTSGWVSTGASAYKNIGYGTNYGPMPVPTRVGYTFNGWWTTASSGGVQISTNTTATITTTQTLYARWTPATYKVIADAVGGTITNASGWTKTGSSATKNVTYTSQYGTLPSASKTGYTFAGWYTASSGGTQITATSRVTSTTAHTLYARWTTNTYPIVANANGGTITNASGWTSSGASAVKRLPYNSNYGTLPTATRVGYTFAGWYTASSGGTQITSANKTSATAQTIYARWTSATYTLTANATGGTITSASGWTKTGAIATKNITYTSQYGTLPNASKIGYTFAGWYTASSGGTQIIAATKVAIAANHTIYARWNANSYLVTIDATGGSITSTSGWSSTGGSAHKIYTYGTSYGAFPTVTRTGYTFLGWYYSTSATGSPITNGSQVTSNHTIYARWSIDNYRIIANATGGTITSTTGWTGTGASAYKIIQSNSTYGTLPTPVRGGYNFAGWWTSTSGGTQITSSTKVTSSATTQTIYARWTTISSYQVIASANGGTITSTSGWTGTGASARRIYVSGSSYGTFPTVTRTGYTFLGWYYSTSATGNPITNGSPVTSNHTIYAKWAVNTSSTYKIIANATGGTITSTSGWTGTGASAYKIIQSNSTYGTLPTPVKGGYSFAGWWTSTSGGTQITSSTKVTSSATTQTIYARWTTISSYQVIANANGGTITSTSGWTGSGASARKNYVAGTPYSTFPTVTRTGYTFLGWYYSTSATGNPITNGSPVTSNHTIYARWAVNTSSTYKIIANATGGTITSTTGWTGTGASAYKIIQSNSTYGKLPTPVKGGYSFAGWWTSTSGGTQITSSTKVTSSATTQTIYARWTTISNYQVTANANGGTITSTSGWTGTGASARRVYVSGSSYGTFPNVTRSGYRFTGWYYSASGSGNPITNGSQVTGNMTIYAGWESNLCTIIYDINTTSTSVYLNTSSKTVAYGSEIGQLATPAYNTSVNQGEVMMIFDGWYTSPNGGSKITSSNICNTVGTLRLYAHWSYIVVPVVTTTR